jgi:signal transduction histidine kinase
MTWLSALRRRSRREWLSGALVLGGLVGFVALTFGLLVVVVGRLLGATDRPSLGLSVVATAIVALGFDPVLTWLERVARHVVHGDRPSPYDTLRRFAGAVGGDERPEDLPLRMARLLAEATGAAWAQVWVSIDDAPVAAATWPPEAEAELVRSPGWDPGTRQLPVRYGDEELGRLVLKERPGSPLTPVEERLFAGLAGQAGLVLRGARLRAMLRRRLEELSVREAELRVSRERLVDAQDEARRRLERDIHDGAQQHLVALAVNLRLAATLATSAPERATTLLELQEKAAEDALDTLARLSQGIYPPLLEQAGVAAALRAVVSDPAAVRTQGDARYPADVEAAAYFCALEALQNAGKHAEAEQVRVEVDAAPDVLTVTVTDDGRGFDPTVSPHGTGLANMRDRIDSAGGIFEIAAAPGTGTRVRVALTADGTTPGDGG